MYERHFGITAPPFRLSPDPAFYFDGPPHHAARRVLAQAFERAEPLLVLSGEIGAGKTTVVRHWCQGLEAGGTVVAHVTNTQLEPGDLLHAVATAFGAPAPAHDADGIAERLDRFMAGLAGRVALLVVDEAQNLAEPALRALIDLAERAAALGVSLRVCLVGQPELRARLAAPALADVRARIQNTVHLEALSPTHTRQYIEHRLHRVGWRGVPSFEPAAMDLIHHWTGGVPRRINVLANRLLLTQFLEVGTRIDARTVGAVAHALHAELGDGALHAFAASPVISAAVPPGALLLLAEGRSDHVKAAALLTALARRPHLPPAVLVSLSEAGGWDLDRELHAYAGIVQTCVRLHGQGRTPDDRTLAAFRDLLEAAPPAALVVFDGSESTRRCAAAAHQCGIALCQVGADPQDDAEAGQDAAPRAAIAAIAGLRFHTKPGSPDDVDPEAADVRAGNLLVDALVLALRMDAERPLAVEPPPAHGTGAYGVVVLKAPPAALRLACRPEVVPVLRELSRDLSLVWPMRPAALLSMRDSGLARALSGDRIACIPQLGHAGYVRLLRDARCVLTDCVDVMEEAAALGVPCLALGVRHVGAGGWLPAIDVGHSPARATRALWQILFNGVVPTPPPALWDGRAGTRIAVRMSEWLAQSERSAPSRPPV